MAEVKKVIKRWEKGWGWLDGRAVVEDVLHTKVDDGTVYVFRVTPDEYHAGHAYFTDFYIVTYETKGHLGEIWGWGESPREALKDAIRKWSGGASNPFMKALKPLKEKVKENIKETLEPVLDELRITEEDLEDILFEDLEDYEYLTGKVVGVLDAKPEFRAYIEDGTVIVYHISDSITYDNKLPFSAYFYIAVLFASNGAGGMEKTWGLGKTIKEALEDAERKWDNLTGGYVNPFRETFEILKGEYNEEDDELV
jgi:predicted RNase H-like HicB family nuclease